MIFGACGGVGGGGVMDCIRPSFSLSLYIYIGFFFRCVCLVVALLFVTFLPHTSRTYCICVYVLLSRYMFSLRVSVLFIIIYYLSSPFFPHILLMYALLLLPPTVPSTTSLVDSFVHRNA